MKLVVFHFIVSFIPFLFLFTMAGEVYFRSPKSSFHRRTALLIMFLSFVFFSDYSSNILPLEEAYYFAFVFKYCNSFVLMSLSIYFFKQISNINLSGKWHFIFLLPLSGIISLILFPSSFNFVINDTAMGLTDVLSTPFVLLTIIASFYTIIWSFYFLRIGFKRAQSEDSSDLYKKRISFIKKGSILTIISFLITIFIAVVGAFFGVSFAFLSPYGVLVFAYIIRYSMIHLDWLPTNGHKYKLLYEISSNGILLVNFQGCIVDANPAFNKMVNLEKDSIIGTEFSQFLTSKDQYTFLDLFRSYYVSSKPMNIELTIEVENGLKTIHVVLLSDYVVIDDKKYVYFVLTDISRQKKYEYQLKHLAFHDPLTGLGNRLYYQEQAVKLLQETYKSQKILGIVLVDLDKFKTINDTYGHLAGDQLLIHVAKQMIKSIPVNTYPYRIGGDEFAIIIVEEKKRNIIAYVERLLENLNENFFFNDSKISITASVGVSFAHEDGSDLGILLNFADKAMYHAKRKGSNQYCLYSAELELND